MSDCATRFHGTRIQAVRSFFGLYYCRRYSDTNENSIPYSQIIQNLHTKIPKIPTSIHHPPSAQQPPHHHHPHELYPSRGHSRIPTPRTYLPIPGEKFPPPVSFYRVSIETQSEWRLIRVLRFPKPALGKNRHWGYVVSREACIHPCGNGLMESW